MKRLIVQLSLASGGHVPVDSPRRAILPRSAIRLAAVLALLAIPVVGLAQTAVFLVRHAERADAGMTAALGADPDLSPAGRARAETLAAMLKDARITQIYVTEYKRTRQTAEPLAKVLAVEPTLIPSKDTPGLVDRLKTASGNVLVVGHSNSVPTVVKALGIEEAITIGESEYDNLLVVILGSRPSLVRLRFR